MFNSTDILEENALHSADLVAVPFRYFLTRRLLNLHFEQNLLQWFETDAPWTLIETDFYEQYEFSMFDSVLPTDISHLLASRVLLTLRRHMARLFHVSFQDRVQVVAHKLCPPQHIAIHNDYMLGEETHRLVIQLNRGLVDADGGLFMLFNSFDPNDIHRILRPLTGSAIGFEIGENSHHAISKLYKGERYTIVFSFYAQSDAS